jgi:hypothetical protein
MLGSSMRRVGLIDITVGNAMRLGAPQRSATRRCASQHIATQRLSRWGTPAARARLARTVPSSACMPLGDLKRELVRRYLEGKRLAEIAKPEAPARCGERPPPVGSPYTKDAALIEFHDKRLRFSFEQLASPRSASATRRSRLISPSTTISAISSPAASMPASAWATRYNVT